MGRGVCAGAVSCTCIAANLSADRVSTLKFWSSAPGAPILQRRWLREPWALLAQVALLLLVIAALGNPRWGQQVRSRDVVMVLDTSVWSQARPLGESPWIDQIRKEARGVLDSLPADDRVLLLRAEPGASAILPATSDRVALTAGNCGGIAFERCRRRSGCARIRQGRVGWFATRLARLRRPGTP